MGRMARRGRERRRASEGGREAREDE